MKFGVREICDVVLRAKAAQKIGNKVFYKNEPVIYFDSLKTSTLEGAATTVYAQGGRGNARLMAWEGERTVTFTMEDALISPVSFSILSGAGLIAANQNKPIIVHTTEQVGSDKFVLDNAANPTYVEITLSQKPYIKSNSAEGYNDTEDFIYAMVLDDNGEIITEPYIAIESLYTPFYTKTTDTTINPNKTYYTLDGTYSPVPSESLSEDDLDTYYEKHEVYPDGSASDGYKIRIYATEQYNSEGNISGNRLSDNTLRKNDLTPFKTASAILIDYYVEHKSGAYQIDISPDKFGGNFYLEASTLFRAENGVDMPAEFIIPNCKVQSNFTFTMASSGDPSTFTFTMDAFPDYTRWNKDKKVFAAIQVINTGETNAELERLGTGHDYEANGSGSDPYATYLSEQQKFIELD